MNRLINTFKYGSWKTRLFFGAILLALLGGAATIAAAAFAGLGIIPIAVGGAAMVLGIGMSTMVTVVSDDDESGENSAGPGGEMSGENGDEPGNGQNAAGSDSMTGENIAGPAEAEQTSQGGAKVQNGNTPAQGGATVNGNAPDKGSAAENSGNTATGTSAKGNAAVNNGNAATGTSTKGNVSVNGGNTAAKGNTAVKSGNIQAEKDAAGNNIPAKKNTDVNAAENSGNVNTGTKTKDNGNEERESLQEAVQRIKDSVIYADDGGRYVPDEITEKPVPKASYVMKRVKNPVSLSPSDGPFIDGLPPEKSPFAAEDAAGPEGSADLKKKNGAGSQNTGKAAANNALNGNIAGRNGNAEVKANTDRNNTLNKAADNTGSKIQNRADASAEDQSNVKKIAKREIFSFDKEKDQATLRAEHLKDIQKAEEGDAGDKPSKSIFKRILGLFPSRKNKAEKEADKEAKKRHIQQGKETRKERKDIKKQIKEKTDEYADSLSEKFENEQSFADREKQREEQYARDVENRRERLNNPEDEQNQEDAETDETTDTGLFKKLGGFFVKLFGNVYDEPESGEDAEDSDDGRKDAVKDKSKDSDKEKKKKKEKAKKDKKKDKKTKAAKDSDKDDGDEESEQSRLDRMKDIATGRAGKDSEPDEEPRRDRLPGEEPDVSKYSASNMKKIIKARKLGKDFIPVFIESWDSKHITQTPALCYVKDNHVHFLLLEGDMERDVSVPTDKFINVWYKKNVPVTNLKLYRNIKENMGAYEMFEDVMPSFASSIDQLGGTSYSQNLYLLGNDIALAPPSMRELRKRFRFNTNIFDSLNTRGEYSDYFKKAYENRILWTDNVIGLQEYQRRIRAILQEMVNDEDLLKFEFEEDVAKMVQYRLITDEYADFYLKLKGKK